ncbi:MFS transporter [Streptomyces sp. SBT349]|uniref:MFS transporter n=1 Tax=Streptomyces sp. SBT349 TaxID=1580539 RepID=UPI00066C5D63|nr:MFS transporter [Streptomyces sp. SBT349]
MTDKRRWLALVALTISVLVLGFDLTILNVALPTMAADIGADTGELQWIVDSYAVVFAAAMLPAGLLGDRFGRRKMLVAGLVIFLGGSILGAVVSTPGPVIAARTIMGVGGALIMPLALSVIPTLFEGEERTKAIGAVTVGMSAGMPFGPLVGGWLLDHFWWGSIFVLNIPLVAIGIVACVMLIPETRDPSATAVDPLNATLGVLGLGAFVYGVIEGPVEGWTSPLILAALIGGLLMLAALVVRERRQTRPMLDLELLGNPTFRWNTIITVLVMFVMMGLMFVLPLFLQAIQGNDAFDTGLRLMPLMASMIVVARAAPLLIARFGTRAVIVGGMALFGVGLLLGARTDAGDGYGYVALWLTVTGLGLGFAMMLTMDAALGALPKGREGTGTGLLTTLRQVGGAIGIAALGSMLNAVFTNRIDTDGLPPEAAETAEESIVAAQAVAAQLDLPQLAESAQSAFMSGMGVVMVVSGIAALVTAVLGAFVLPDERKQKALESAPGPDSPQAESLPGAGGVAGQ